MVENETRLPLQQFTQMVARQRLSNPPGELKESGWTKIATIWTVIGGIVALISLYIAYRQ
jgi:hypothetical protein